jgi:two-component system alkaline phosphatase synthesis response regulator PhoP
LRIRFRVLAGGSPLLLSPREFQILEYLIAHRSETVTREQLLGIVWGYDGFPLTRTVDVRLAKLRQKIEQNPGDSRYIITVHRMGYKFVG